MDLGSEPGSAAAQLLIGLASGAVRFVLGSRGAGVGSNHGRIEDQPLHIGVLQHFKHRDPDALPRPAVEPLPTGAPVAKPLGQVASRGTGSSNPEHGVEERAVAFTQLVRFRRANGKKRLDANPISIRNRVARQRGVPSLAEAESRPLRQNHHQCPHDLVYV